MLISLQCYTGGTKKVVLNEMQAKGFFQAKQYFGPTRTTVTFDLFSIFFIKNFVIYFSQF